jgi:hypothetical protein
MSILNGAASSFDALKGGVVGALLVGALAAVVSGVIIGTGGTVLGAVTIAGISMGLGGAMGIGASGLKSYQRGQAGDLTAVSTAKIADNLSGSKDVNSTNFAKNAVAKSSVVGVAR